MEKNLYDQIIELAGLPEQDANSFLEKSFHQYGKQIKNGDLDDLRFVLANILQDLILATEEH